MTIGQKIDSLESQLGKTYGKQKLLILHELTNLLIQSDSRRAVRYAKQAQELGDNIITPSNSMIERSDYFLKVKSYVLLGKSYFEREQYLEANQAFERAAKEAEAIQYTSMNGEIAEYEARLKTIAKQDSKAVEGNFFKRNFGNLGIGEVISETTDDVAISTALKSAESQEKSGNYDRAIDNYQKAINLLRDRGDSRQITKIREHIGDLYFQYNELEDALDYFVLAKEDHLKTSDSIGVASIQSKIEEIQNLKEAHKIIAQNVEENLNAFSPEKPDKRVDAQKPAAETSEEIKKLAQQMEEEQDYKKSLEYYKLYSELQEKYAEEEQQKELALLEQDRINREITLLKQDQEIRELRLAQSEQDLRRQTRFRNNLLFGSVLLLGLAFALLYLYRNKKRDHTKLQLAYNDLDVARNQLSDAEKKIKTLLHQQVSRAVAHELLSSETTDKIERKFVCIMFLDIRDFTPYAEMRDPEEIIRYQNDVFGFMIDIVEKNQGIINQLLGDGFMATFGAPVCAGNDCDNAVKAALEILGTLEKKSQEDVFPKTNIGIGLHAGYVVAGNVGTEGRKQYSITGNTVIIASRIEQLNKTLGSRILISREVYDQLSNKNGWDENFREVEVKGRKDPVLVMSLG